MPPEYTVTVTVTRIGPREFEISADPATLPEQLPQDMADWLLREHGVDAVERGVGVIPVEDWPPGAGDPPDQAGSTGGE